MVDVELDADLVESWEKGEITQDQALNTQIIRNQEAFMRAAAVLEDKKKDVPPGLNLVPRKNPR